MRIDYTGHFKRDLKLCVKRRCDITKLLDFVDLVINGRTLPERYENHRLSGEWSGYFDAHLEPDWIIIYSLTEDALILERTGTHSDLF
jgi:mRNA interferase YafQ